MSPGCEQIAPSAAIGTVTSVTSVATDDRVELLAHIPLFSSPSRNELAILGAAPWEATIVADSAASLLVVARRPFKAVLDDAPGLGAKALVAPAQRLREAERRSAVL